MKSHIVVFLIRDQDATQYLELKVYQKAPSLEDCARATDEGEKLIAAIPLFDPDKEIPRGIENIVAGLIQADELGFALEDALNHICRVLGKL